MITVVGTSPQTAGTWSTVDRDQAIERLFREEYRPLLRLVALLVDDTASAEDVVQDAFVKLHRAWPRVRSIDDAPAYLRSIAMNTARSRLRRRLVSDGSLQYVPDAVQRSAGLRSREWKRRQGRERR